MQVEGIYRVNGNQADIGLIEQKVEESKYKTHCTNGAIYYMRVKRSPRTDLLQCVLQKQ